MMTWGLILGTYVGYPNNNKEWFTHSNTTVPTVVNGVVWNGSESLCTSHVSNKNTVFEQKLAIVQ